jgi:hypothetical protein
LRPAQPGTHGDPCSKRASAHAAAAAPPVFTSYDARDLDEPAAGFDSILQALAAIARGEAVVVLDDEDRENEGDLIIAADKLTPESMAFMVKHTSGVVCVGLEGAALDRLRVPLMVGTADNEEAMLTAFTVTVDLREGTTTGISAADRTLTIRALADPHSQPGDFKRPGHIFPLRYREVSAAALRARLRLESLPPVPPDRCAPLPPHRAACCGARATPRRRSTWRGSQAASRPGCCAKSSHRTAAWHGRLSCWPLERSTG